MCTNYAPSTRAALAASFDLPMPLEDWPGEAWRGYLAPIVLQHPHAGRVIELGRFGLVPPWIRTAADARKISGGTMNARAETVAAKPSFKSAWHKSHRCLVPMARFYEPDWRSGKAVRTAVALSDGGDFAVAGLWSWWRDPDRDVGHATFAMLTINADAHPVMNQLHRAGDEKRSLVIVPREAWGDWLEAEPEQSRALLVPYPADGLRLIPAPLPPRVSRKAAAAADEAPDNPLV